MTRLTQKDLAQELGISTGMVTQLKRQGMPTDSVAAAAQWRAANVRPYDRSETSPTAPTGYHEARARREAAEADLAELKLAELRGELIRVEVVRSSLAGVFASTRDRLMQLPDRLATVLAAEGDRDKVHVLLADEIHHALTQLASAGG